MKISSIVRVCGLFCKLALQFSVLLSSFSCFHISKLKWCALTLNDQLCGNTPLLRSAHLLWCCTQIHLPLCKEYFNLTHKCLRIHVNPHIWKGSVLRAGQGAGMENPCLSSPSTALRGVSELTLNAQSLKLGWKKGQSYVCWLINNAGTISQRAGVTEHLLQPVGCRKSVVELQLSVKEWEVRAPALPKILLAWKRDESTQYGKSRNLNWNTSSKS